MTPLERLEGYGLGKRLSPSLDEIRRALAVAQAVEEMPSSFNKEIIMRRADELLRGEK